MKRTSIACLLLAGLGGCMSSKPSATPVTPMNQAYRGKESKDLVGPYGEPITLTNYQARAKDAGIVRAEGVDRGKGGIVKSDYLDKGQGKIIQTAGGRYGGPDAGGKFAGPVGPTGYPAYSPSMGIRPVPAMGPWGAVAGIGMMGPMQNQFPLNSRTSVKFVDPVGMKIQWYGANGNLTDTVLETPAVYNFPQGGTYRLKLSGIKGRPEMELYPTLQVFPTAPKTATFLDHSSVPVVFTDDDFAQVAAGNFLVKVVYLPDPIYQDLAAVAGPAEVISTRLDPGVDPVAEALKRGTPLLVIRIGNIDLEAKGTPPLSTPNPFAGPGGFGLGGMIPPPAPAPGKSPSPSPSDKEKAPLPPSGALVDPNIKLPEVLDKK